MRTQLFFLTILISFTFSKLNAQCPEGDVQFFSQADVDYFTANYPNCTHITGDLIFGVFNGPNNNITDLSGLINLTKIDGYLGVFSTTELVSLNGFNNLQDLGGLNLVFNQNLESLTELINITELSSNQLQIGFNPSLQSLQGLNNIQTISGRLYLGAGNDNLTSFAGLNSLVSVGGIVYISDTYVTTLEGLENLGHIGSYLTLSVNPNLENIEALNNLTFAKGLGIYENPLLISLNGVQNISPTTLSTEGVFIKDNGNLSTCNLPNICEYLSFNPTENPREISGNTGNCTDEQAVLAACGLGISDVENNDANWNVLYQKSKGSFLIQSNGFQISDIQVYNLKGQLIKEKVGLNSNKEELKIFTPENILIIKVISKEGKSFAKKIIAN